MQGELNREFVTFGGKKQIGSGGGARGGEEEESKSSASPNPSRVWNAS